MFGGIGVSVGEISNHYFWYDYFLTISQSHDQNYLDIDEHFTMNMQDLFLSIMEVMYELFNINKNKSNMNLIYLEERKAVQAPGIRGSEQNQSTIRYRCFFNPLPGES